AGGHTSWTLALILVAQRPPRPPLFPYTTLFRSDAIVPASIRTPDPLDLPESMTEVDALAKIRDIADRNKVFRSFIGQGYHGTHRSEEHTSELQSRENLVCRLLLENKNATRR